MIINWNDKGDKKLQRGEAQCYYLELTETGDKRKVLVH